MKVRKLYPLAAALGVWVGGASHAAEPARLPGTGADNQVTADAVAAVLGTSPAVRGADVRISAQGGVVILRGTAPSAAHQKAIAAAALTAQGVQMVKDEMTVSAVVPAQATLAPPMPVPTAPIPLGPVGPGGEGPIVEPGAVGVPGQVSPDMMAPNLPAYAWPTYAPYNNFSRVGYPTAYPYNAFPFIGPFYPFPKVPLGWRKVVMEWEDGHWYIGKASAPHDYWRVKFW